MRFEVNSIVRRIEELRIQAGMSHNKLAQKIGVSANTVYHWCKSDAMPTLANIEHISEVFGMSVEQFFHGLGEVSADSATAKFLTSWRTLSAQEKEAVRKVMDAFISIRRGE